MDLIPHNYLDPAGDESRSAIPSFEDLQMRLLNRIRSQAVSRAYDRVYSAATIP